MDKQVEELVEWAAAKCWLSHVNHARLTDKFIPEGLDETDFRKQIHINHAMFEDLAKQILSYPDLALVVDKGGAIFSNRKGMHQVRAEIIPLAEALKEVR